ncbi:hypothetical protein E5163_06950 [Marinicauda algicola]|uniref:Aminopeptidase n=1 Tax=Marinicauda algicola TaxID=2029849 RepID=A0A4V3RY41_9PROT|nr:hypothetical protein [Marinicauda algicola]TGY88869.1 hypothetical protein E5163_06950 [Marinicauda algicola]
MIAARLVLVALCAGLVLASRAGAGGSHDDPIGAAALDDVLEPAVRALVAEAFSVVERHGEEVWPGFAAAPRQIVVATPGHDVLLCPDGPVSGFAPLGPDPVSGCEAYVRDLTFPERIAASFPAVEGRPTVVIGLPAFLQAEPFDWTVTVVHERFHQYQQAWPGYYAAVDALDLAGGDEGGMWMLNYPFPYDEPQVEAAFDAMAGMLLAALDAPDDGVEEAAAAYWAAREAARLSVPERDWRYFEFQLWNEGLSRWTERAISEAAGRHDPDYAAHAEHERLSMINSLQALRQDGLGAWKRSAVYAIGAGEGALLERIRPGWRAAYFAEPMQTGSYFRFDPVEPGEGR